MSSAGAQPWAMGGAEGQGDQPPLLCAVVVEPRGCTARCAPHGRVSAACDTMGRGLEA
jgi:hypothetical protein